MFSISSLLSTPLFTLAHLRTWPNGVLEAWCEEDEGIATGWAGSGRAKRAPALSATVLFDSARL